MSNNDESAVKALYQQILDSWNAQDAHTYMSLFDEKAHLIGFDGSQMQGRANIESTLGSIFADHPTARYIAIIRDIRFLSPEIALLKADVGMVPREQSDINPDANAIQTLVATRQDGQWLASLFQNTPAQFHGRPDLSDALSAELRDLSAKIFD